MTREDLITFKTWFDTYVPSFSMPNEEDQGNITIKQQHTRRVCQYAVRIAGELKLDNDKALLAEAIALFHDVGRFPQYQRYRTFNDSISVNHGALGAQVLLETGVLKILPKHEQDLVVRAVTLHNVFSLPAGLDGDLMLFAQLVRDADKLDILHVLLEYYSLSEADRSPVVGLGLPDTPGYSPEILDALLRQELVRMSSMQTLNDFKLLQLTWLYDINFLPSIRIVAEREYVRRIEDALPKTREIRQAIDAVRSYMNRRLQTARS